MLSALRLRHRARDDETDMWRFTRLFQALAAFEESLQAEKLGLQKRCESVTATAAFAQERYENHRLEAALSTQVDEMTCSMKDYTRRLNALQNQIEFIGHLRQVTESRAGANGALSASMRLQTVHPRGKRRQVGECRDFQND